MSFKKLKTVRLQIQKRVAQSSSMEKYKHLIGLERLHRGKNRKMKTLMHGVLHTNCLCS